MLLKPRPHYIEMSQAIYSKKLTDPTVRQWPYDLSVEFRLNTEDLKLCISRRMVNVQPDKHIFLYKSDVNYFEHGDGIRGTYIRFNFKDQPEGQEVIFLKGDHLITIDDLIIKKDIGILAFSSLELKIIKSRYRDMRRKLERIRAQENRAC